MKLLRYGNPGQEKPGLLDEQGSIRDLSGHVADINGDMLSPSSIKKLQDLDASSLPMVSNDVRIGACVGNIGKFLCIGLNYSDHAAETGSEVPKEPILFTKATSAVVGPNDDVVIPRGSTKTDWEVELAIVIGTAAKYVSEAEAANHIAGYCVVNDVSERDFQTKRSGQWTKGKSCDTFGPTGPWLVTSDEVPDPQNLDLWLDVDGRRMQTGNTRTMIFSCNFIVSYLSQFFTLHPGDIISTGTPPGVGMGKKPDPIFLSAGQSMQLGVEGLGTQTQTVKADWAN